VEPGMMLKSLHSRGKGKRTSKSRLAWMMQQGPDSKKHFLTKLGFIKIKTFCSLKRHY
jgi:hypothetical protein